MAPSYQPMKSMTLYQLIPIRELKFSASHYVISKHQDQLVVDALTRTLYGHPTEREAAYLFERLFEHVYVYRGRRLNMGRRVFWHKVTEAWEEADEDVVRALVLVIILAERRWPGAKSAETHPFLRNLRLVNDYFVRSEYHSDEAHEILAEVEYAKRAKNAFTVVPKFRFAWQSLSAGNTFDVERALMMIALGPNGTSRPKWARGSGPFVRRWTMTFSDVSTNGDDKSKPMSKGHRKRERKEKRELKEIEGMFEKGKGDVELIGQEEDGKDRDGIPMLDGDGESGGGIQTDDNRDTDGERVDKQVSLAMDADAA
ncbi:hypothetical protein GE09DRAFT_1056201 [Coniochaeta sp. 2T2.1]|nr:hypothetical protein GE09DRAFT_1056201 [Coniochaeta sp. 2T2.1]